MKIDHPARAALTALACTAAAALGAPSASFAAVDCEYVDTQPKRAEVILAGACVVRTVMDKLSKESFVVSDRGLRHGLLVERFGPLERPA